MDSDRTVRAPTRENEDKALAEKVRAAAQALNTAVTAAYQAGLFVEFDLRETRADEAGYEILEVKISRHYNL